MLRVFLLLAVALGLCLLAPGQALAQGCAMCGTAVKDASDPLARSMASSILFMLSMPFLLFFSVAGWLLYHFRRDRRRQEDTQAKENPS